MRLEVGPADGKASCRHQHALLSLSRTAAMDTNAAPVVSPLPDNISASETRRLEAQPAHHVHAHSKKALPSEDAEDPLDALREHSLRKESGVEARRHERLDHAAARAAKHEVDTPDKVRFNKPTRRAGFGSLSACTIAASAASRAAHSDTRNLRIVSVCCLPQSSASLASRFRHAMTRPHPCRCRSRARRRRRRARWAPGGAPGRAHQD